MSGQTYTLFFRDVEVGTVRHADEDFPNLWGTFTTSTKTDHPTLRERLHHYVAFSREAGRLVENPSAEDEYQQFLSLHEAKFIDMIACDDWILVDSSGREHPILVPVFDDAGIVWRWNFS